MYRQCGGIVFVTRGAVVFSNVSGVGSTIIWFLEGAIVTVVKWGVSHVQWRAVVVSFFFFLLENVCYGFPSEFVPKKTGKL